MDEHREFVDKAQEAIRRDESSIRSVQQGWIIRRNQIAALIEALDKAIKASRDRQRDTRSL